MQTHSSTSSRFKNESALVMLVAASATSYVGDLRPVMLMLGGAPATLVMTDGTRTSGALGEHAVVPIAEIESVLLRVFGRNGVDRVHSFAQLPFDWDRNGGEPMSQASLQALVKFFNHAGIAPDGASIFMAHSGQLIANWHDAHQRLIELQFQPDSVAYFIEATGADDSVPLGDIGATKLRRLIEAADHL